MTRRIWLLAAALAAALTALPGAAVTMAAPAAQATSILSTSHLRGLVLPAWDTNGGPALTNSTVESAVTAAHVNVVRYSILDCLTTQTCGQDNHTGTLTASTLEAAITKITEPVSSGGLGAIPWIEFPPTAHGAIGPFSDGSVMCPPLSDLSAWKLLDQNILDDVAAVYTGPIILQADGNEPEYDCATDPTYGWGFTSAFASGVSTDVGTFWADTGPALFGAALLDGFSQVVNVAYIPDPPGTSHGTNSCTNNGGTFTCTIDPTAINNFNNAVKSSGNSAPPVESMGSSYCHSADNATSPGAANPYAFSSNLCTALDTAWITKWRARVNAIWGATTGNAMEAADAEWQAGTCTASTDCWEASGTAGDGSGFPDGVGSYVDSYVSMLQGNGSLTGPSGTEFWGACLFGIPGGNAKPATPSTPSPGQYDLVYSDGTTPSWYSNVQTDYASLP